jgi:hypothetical protein
LRGDAQACNRAAWREAVLHWVSEKMWALLSLVPGVFVDRDDPHFALVRGLVGLLVIVLVVYVVAMGPIRAVIRRNTDKRKRGGPRGVEKP